MEHESEPTPVPGPRGDRRRSRRARRKVGLTLAVLTVALVGLVVLLMRLMTGPSRVDADSAGRFVYVKSFGTKEGPLRNPLGIAASDGRVYVAESDAGVVQVFSTDGKPRGTLELPPRSDGTTAYPSAVAPLGDDRLAVLDLASRRIVVFSLDRRSSGTVVDVLGSVEPSHVPVQPTALTATPRGVLVADADDHTLKEYDAKGFRLRVLAADLKPPLTFVNGLAISDGTVYVSDSNARRVVALPLTDGKTRVLPVRFALPKGLAAWSDGLLVADPFAGEAGAYDASGVKEGVLQLPEKTRWKPTAIAWIKSADRVYVTDPAAGAVHVFRSVRRP